MVASISSSTVNNWSASLFSKLDTKKQGYVDQADLAAALGTDATGSTTNSDDAAEMVKQFDGDGDGKITQSELSSAISKVADELNAQFDSSRVDKSQAGAAATDEDDTAVSATGPASTAGAAKGAPPGGGGGAVPVSASSATSDNKYVQAADTDTDGTVTDEEAVAYKKLLASQAEGKQVNGGDSDKDVARALDLLKNYVENSGSATTSARTVDVST
jgi:hypothetical protein